MNKVIGVVVAILVLGAVAAVAFVATQKHTTKNNALDSVSSAPLVPVAFPPVDAKFLPPDVSADGVMSSVSSQRKEVDRLAAEADVVGLWVPATGWEGEVVDLTDERGGFAVRLYVTTGGLVGGFYIVAVVPEEPDDMRKGDRATVQGRIDKVQVLPGGAIPIHRIVLSPAKVIGHQKFRR